MARQNTLRGCIIRKWQNSGGSRLVEYVKVLAWAEACDKDLEKRGIEPAPKFRVTRKDKNGSNEQYQRTWLGGCRFPFRIICNPGSIKTTSDTPEIKEIPLAVNAYRACLKCGRLSFCDAIYCSYCGQHMPR